MLEVGADEKNEQRASKDLRTAVNCDILTQKRTAFLQQLTSYLAKVARFK